ncbi:MAG: chromosome partitioning protein [Geodermatophilaceae bacterium]|nr:chromosome partitioning protein [Geodermatophilaceae bacterium]
MGMPVLTAVTGATWEADLVGELDRADHGVTVVRRCVDLAELLAAAAAGTARAALLSAELRRLDRDAVTRLYAAGIAIVGLIDPGDEVAENRLRALGVGQVLTADAGADLIAAALREAADGLGEASVRFDLGDPGAAMPRLGTPTPPPSIPIGRGRIVAVWGPTGAPGRTTVAVNLADEAGRLGVPSMLVDADVYGGVVAQYLGLLDESPGVAAAARSASAGTLDAAALARIAWAVTPNLRVLTGLSRADRWPELRPSSLATVLERSRALAELVVVDCGFCLEQDEELSYDTAAPRRNGATLSLLAAADVVLCVSGADPVALQRTVRALAELRETLPDLVPMVVVNRARPVVVPGDVRAEIAGALDRFAGVRDPVFLPHDAKATDAALAAGRTLAEVASGSLLRVALRDLAGSLAGLPAATGPRPRKRSRVRRSV